MKRRIDPTNSRHRMAHVSNGPQSKERADCQDEHTFTIMRLSQFAVWMNRH